MSRKRIIGYLLMSPVILTIAVFVGALIYSWFLFYPFQMSALVVVLAFVAGAFLLFVDDEEKREAEKRKKSG